MADFSVCVGYTATVFLALAPEQGIEITSIIPPISVRRAMSAATVNCPSCGTILDVDDPLPTRARLKCPDCGTVFRAPATDASVAPAPAKSPSKAARSETKEKASPAQPKKSRSTGRKVLMGCALAVVLIGVLAAGTLAILFAVGINLWDRTVAQATFPSLPRVTGPEKPDTQKTTKTGEDTKKAPIETGTQAPGRWQQATAVSAAFRSGARRSDGSPCRPRSKRRWPNCSRRARSEPAVRYSTSQVMKIP